MAEKINVIAIVSPAPGKKEWVLELLKAAMKNVRSETGILQYDLFFEERTGDIIFIEKYESKAVLDAHMTTPYFADFGKTAEAEGLLAKPVELKFSEYVIGLA